MTDKNRTYFLDSLRALAIFMVVAAHARGYCQGLTATESWLITFIVTRWVPLFFLVDGFLFCESSLSGRPYSYGAYVLKSGRRLLVPWAVFTVFYVLARYPMEQAGLVNDNLIVGKPLSTIAVFAWGSVYAGQLYFLASLFLVRLATPAMRRLCAMTRPRAVLFCVVFFLAYKIVVGPLDQAIKIPGGQEPLLHALWGAQFYLVGVLLRLFLKTVSRASLAICVVSLTIFAVLETISPARLGLFKPLVLHFRSLGIFTLFLWACRGRTQTSRIGRNTMGIYLLHTPLLLKAASLVAVHLAAPPLAVYAGVTISVFFAAYGLAELLTKLPYGSMLFGLETGGRRSIDPGNREPAALAYANKPP